VVIENRGGIDYISEDCELRIANCELKEGTVTILAGGSQTLNLVVPYLKKDTYPIILQLKDQKIVKYIDIDGLNPELQIGLDKDQYLTGESPVVIYSVSDQYPIEGSLSLTLQSPYPNWKIYTDTRETKGIVISQQSLVNSLYLATLGGLKVFDGASWTTYTKADGLPTHNLYDIAISDQQSAISLYIASSEGLVLHFI